MHLLEGERVLQESDTGELTLTTHRVRFDASRFGRAQVTSMMLEEVASCEITYRSSIWYLAIGVAALLGGIASQRSAGLLVGVLVAGVLGLGYVLSRRSVLELASAGAVIRVQVASRSLKATKAFLDALEAAKNDRYLLGREIVA